VGGVAAVTLSRPRLLSAYISSIARLQIFVTNSKSRNDKAFSALSLGLSRLFGQNLRRITMRNNDNINQYVDLNESLQTLAFRFANEMKQQLLIRFVFFIRWK